MRTIWFVAAAMVLVAGGGIAFADDAVDPTAVKSEDGKYFDKEGNPTFKIGADGTVDWYTYSGYRRYHSECHVCHGPDGMGSTYAPALTEFAQDHELWRLPRRGRERPQERRRSQENVMPAFGDNRERRLLHGRPLHLSACPRQ